MPAPWGTLAGLMPLPATFGALVYMVLLGACMNEVGGLLVPKAPGGVAAHFLVCEDWHFYQSTSVGPQGDEFLASGAGRNGIGKAELPFQLIVCIGCLYMPHGHPEGFLHD